MGARPILSGALFQMMIDEGFSMNNRITLKKNTKKNLFCYAMIAYPVLHFLLFIVYVNFSMVVESFYNWNPSTGNTDYVGLLNYQNLFARIGNDVTLRFSIRNTLLWIPLGIFVMVPVSLLVAYFLSKKIRFHKFYQAMFFFPCILSIVVTTMAFYFMVHPTMGAVNSVLKTIGLESLKRTWLGDLKTALPTVMFFCIWVGFGMNTIMIGSSISRIPADIYDVGRLEGIGLFRELVSVVIPMIWPTLTTQVVLAASGSFAVFIQPQLLTNGGPNGSTSTIALYLVDQVKNANYGRAAALGVLIAVFGMLIVSMVRWVMDQRESVEM